MRDVLAIAAELEALAVRAKELAAELRAGAEASAAASTHGAARRLLTAEELSEESGLPTQTIYRLARTGDLPFVRIGERGVRFREEALDALGGIDA